MNRQITKRQYVACVGIGAALIILMFSPIPGINCVGIIGMISLASYFKLGSSGFRHPLLIMFYILAMLGCGLLENFQLPTIRPADKAIFPILCEVSIYGLYIFGAIHGYYDLQKKGIIRDNNDKE